MGSNAPGQRPTLTVEFSIGFKLGLEIFQPCAKILRLFQIYYAQPNNKHLFLNNMLPRPAPIGSQINNILHFSMQDIWYYD